ncbi:hypothetical protein [Thiomicrospira microaerophila]|uniref:hypothetical protein n=1 Tax=Thiomicrospira microaerophila TaxID=406020 RepID=UPI0005C8F923|nr:hypothetical protein [Thiomicrospira microaerophila]
MKNTSQKPDNHPPSRDPLMALFRYGKLPKITHQLLLAASLIAASYWLYFAIVKMQLLPRFLAGEALILDAVVGFPLVLALAIVVYAVVFWLVKLMVIIFYPSWLTLPSDYYDDADESYFDPTEPPDDKRTQ